jgi:hypothetical protein
VSVPKDVNRAVVIVMDAIIAQVAIVIEAVRDRSLQREGPLSLPTNLDATLTPKANVSLAKQRKRGMTRTSNSRHPQRLSRHRLLARQRPRLVQSRVRDQKARKVVSNALIAVSVVNAADAIGEVVVVVGVDVVRMVARAIRKTVANKEVLSPMGHLRGAPIMLNPRQDVSRGQTRDRHRSRALTCRTPQANHERRERTLLSPPLNLHLPRQVSRVVAKGKASPSGHRARAAARVPGAEPRSATSRGIA